MLAVVIVGISVSALVSGLATAANAGVVQRDGALADTLLRNLAESAKADARTCSPGDRLSVDLTVPEGWSAAVEPGAPVCPATTATSRLRMTVTGPDGRPSSLEVAVRAP